LIYSAKILQFYTYQTVYIDGNCDSDGINICGDDFVNNGTTITIR
jgi:hypothetical protein